MNWRDFVFLVDLIIQPLKRFGIQVAAVGYKTVKISLFVCVE